MCADLSELSNYALVSNVAYRILKSHTPGPFTFLLKATPEVPRRLQHPKRKTIGLRIPESNILQSLILSNGEPIMSTSLILAEQTVALSDPRDFPTKLKSLVDLIIDGGVCGQQPTTVIDFTGNSPELVRAGCGASPLFKQY
jgi:tRNA threonylcarbamoyl adenosine modification protein (Sua5/YciO/YrdC/YwlC family)